VRQLRDLIERTGRLSALGTLAASIAHEIRNPLVAVRTFFQLAPKRWHEEDFANDFRELAEKEVLRISNLVTELLTTARPPTLTMEHFAIDDLIAPIVMLLSPFARSQRVRLEYQAATEAAPVYGAPDQLKQVLLNIVLNAVEATPPEGLVRVGTSRVSRAEGVFCRIEVRDTGLGIPSAVRERIFDPFFTTKADGTGLGLSIARRVVVEHNGFIAVDGSTRQGTCFRVDLPLVAASAVAEDTTPLTRDV